MGNLENIKIETLKRIPTEGGEVMHCLKSTDYAEFNFGEAYISRVDWGVIRGWKLHKNMTLNLVVPLGSVEFVFCEKSYINSYDYRIEIIGNERYSRLSVPPNIWFAFRGLASPHSLILNQASIEHDPGEVSRLSIDAIHYDLRQIN